MDHTPAGHLLSPKQWLAAYQGSITGCWETALINIYSICYRLVGREVFIQMINEYIETDPGSQHDLAYYGAGFANFIAAYSSVELPAYLADVAKLEWAWYQLYASPNTDESHLQAELITCGMRDEVIFSLIPGCGLISSPYPIHQVWEANEFRLNVIISAKKSDQHFYFLVWRKDSAFHINSLEADEWEVLTWIKQGLSIGEIKENMELLNIASCLDAMLDRFIQQGWLNDFCMTKSA